MNMSMIDFEYHKEREQDWIKSIVAGMDKQLGIESRINLLEACCKPVHEGTVVKLANSSREILRNLF